MVQDNLIRCFVAVELPAGLLQEIGTFTRKLSEHSAGIRWVRPAGIHLTLKFLGEISPLKVDDVRNVLTGIGDVAAPFELTIRGSGCFPDRRRPRVIWLGLEHDQAHTLFKLHEWLDNKLAGLEFEQEQRRFSPHLTLGRVTGREDFSPLFSYLDRHPFPERTFNVDKIYLIRSSLQPSGAVYSAIADYPLRKES